jgi:hypothetical protein
VARRDLLRYQQVVVLARAVFGAAPVSHQGEALARNMHPDFPQQQSALQSQHASARFKKPKVRRHLLALLG